MKILKVQFTEEEEKQIFYALTERFDLNNSNIFGKGQTIEFSLNELVEVEATLDLYQYGYYEKDTNASIITERSVGKFKLTFFIDGEEIDVKRISKVNESIEDKINNFYRI